jgi:hypothetical protein
VLLLGTSYLALEKVEVGPDAVVRRGWWGLFRVELKYTELRQIRTVQHHRPWRRSPHWESLHYQTRDGHDGTLCESTNRSGLFFWAKIHLLQSAARRGVEVRHEHDYGN